MKDTGRGQETEEQRTGNSRTKERTTVEQNHRKGDIRDR
jgi:hypothetical protein